MFLMTDFPQICNPVEEENEDEFNTPAKILRLINTASAFELVPSGMQLSERYEFGACLCILTMKGWNVSAMMSIR